MTRHYTTRQPHPREWTERERLREQERLEYRAAAVAKAYQDVRAAALRAGLIGPGLPTMAQLLDFK